MRTTVSFYETNSGLRVGIARCTHVPRKHDLIVFDRAVFRVSEIWFVMRGGALVPRVAVESVPYKFPDGTPGGAPKIRKKRGFKG